MFDISKEQLRQLKADTLRELVARLCEAELRQAGMPVSAVKWGGAQETRDGGLDVDCVVKDERFSGDFVPCARTGFQVKKQSMPPSEIAKEMSPKGQLREVFHELAKDGGCYIIVSLEDDPTDNETILSRLEAMQRQVEPTRSQGDLRTEFYGRGKLVQWLNQHPGVRLWVRDRLDLPLTGWRPLERWTTTPLGHDDDLICASGIGIFLPGREQIKLDLVQGIDGIRDLVRTSGKAVRIVGLSGVGKTRIVQALFEESVGNNPLDKNLVTYADLSEGPNPSAREVIERLEAEDREAIVILDNCPSDRHNQLAGLVSSSPKLHLITVEYDIREDKPEVTSVVRIDADGTEIAEKLVARRYPSLGQVNVRRIAEFSGGNARLALALADSVSERDSLSAFSNAELFDRLFYKRGVPDTDFLEATEVLSLVYSYSIQQDEDGVDELAVLAGLLKHDRLKFYRVTQRLVEGQLAQKRGRWRAVLPHALSNHLASRALRNMPTQDILDAFQPHTRLLKSFGKRLGFLHDHEVAQEIVGSWMSPGGLLHDVGQLNEDGIQLLLNVAPVAPDAVLNAIEVYAARPEADHLFITGNLRASTIVDLLCAIAYDPVLFERCVSVLARFVLMENEGNAPGQYQSRLYGLFALHLSGTEADPDAREAVARRYLFGDNDKERQLGLGMVKAALQSRHWFSLGTFEFGARRRSYGYRPRSYEEQTAWYRRFVTLCADVAATADSELSDGARGLLANELRALWRIRGLREVLAALAKDMNDRQPWLEGWRAVRSIKHYDYRKVAGEGVLDGAELLDELDQMLKPKRLADEVRNYVFTPDLQRFAMDDEFNFDSDHRWQESRNRAAAVARDLGMVVADEPEVMDELSLDFFTTGTGGFLYDFGRGVASKCKDLRALWDNLVESFGLAGDRWRQCGILGGVLAGVHERDGSLAREFLDQAVGNRLLRRAIVSLQTSVPLDAGSVERMGRALEFEDTPLWQFGDLAWHRPLDAWSETDVRDVLMKMVDRPSGAETVLNGLTMRILVLKEENRMLGPELKKVGLSASAAVLRNELDFDGSGITEHNLSEVWKSCMDEDEFPEETNAVRDAYFVRLKKSHGFVDDIEKAVAVLAERATVRFLDGVFFDPTLQDYHRQAIFKEQREGRNALSNIHAAKLLDWCERGNFQRRLLLISGAVFPFEEEAEGSGVVFSNQALAVLNGTQDPVTVLGNFASYVGPNICWGSGADVIAKRSRPFEALLEHDRPEIRRAAQEQVVRIKEWEAQERALDRALDKHNEQRFE